MVVGNPPPGIVTTVTTVVSLCLRLRLCLTIYAALRLCALALARVMRIMRVPCAAANHHRYSGGGGVSGGYRGGGIETSGRLLFLGRWGRARVTRRWQWQQVTAILLLTNTHPQLLLLLVTVGLLLHRHIQHSINDASALSACLASSLHSALVGDTGQARVGRSVGGTDRCLPVRGCGQTGRWGVRHRQGHRH